MRNSDSEKHVPWASRELTPEDVAERLETRVSDFRCEAILDPGTRQSLSRRFWRAE